LDDQITNGNSSRRLLSALLTALVLVLAYAVIHPATIQAAWAEFA